MLLKIYFLIHLLTTIYSNSNPNHHQVSLEARAVILPFDKYIAKATIVIEALKFSITKGVLDLKGNDKPRLNEVLTDLQDKLKTVKQNMHFTNDNDLKMLLEDLITLIKSGHKYSKRKTLDPTLKAWHDNRETVMEQMKDLESSLIKIYVGHFQTANRIVVELKTREKELSEVERKEIAKIERKSEEFKKLVKHLKSEVEAVSKSCGKHFVYKWCINFQKQIDNLLNSNKYPEEELPIIYEYLIGLNQGQKGGKVISKDEKEVLEELDGKLRKIVIIVSSIEVEVTIFVEKLGKNSKFNFGKITADIERLGINLAERNQQS